MQNRVQTETQAPRRNFLRFTEDAANGGASVPAEGYVTRKDLEAAEKRIAETVQNAVQQFVQQRQATPATPPEEDARRRQMRSMAD